MKKLLSLFFVAAVAMTVKAYAAVGDTFTQGSVTYVVKTANTVGIQKVASSATSVELSTTVIDGSNEYKVVSVEEYAFRYSEANEIVVPETVESIGYGGFYSCKTSKIVLQKGLKTIGNYAFYAARSLTSITIPEGVEEIGTSTVGSVFGTCYALKSVVFPSTLKKIWNSTFYHCGLESVELPANLEEIGKNVFNTCESLTSVKMSPKLKTIGVGAFGGCKNLATITDMPSTVETIGEEAFFGCPLTEFTIPSLCSEIGTRAFANTSIAKISIEAGNKSFVLNGDAVYKSDKSLLVAYPPKSANTTVTIIDGCKGVSGGAFQGSNVTTVNMPSSLIALDDFAFCQSALTNVKLSENLVYMGEQAFAATNITSMTVPNGLRDLSDAVFAGCEKLTSVTFGSNLKTFGIRQFYKCTALTDVYFSGSKAPEIGYWEYTSESPFYGIAAKQVTVHCPKGTSAVYKDFKDFDAVKEISENTTGIFSPESITPADKADVSTFDKLTLTFSETATAVKTNPAIKVICGQLVAGIPMGTEVEVGMWSVLNNKSKEPYIVPLDEYGEDGMPIKMESGKTYFVIVPAGTFKNEAGDLNEEITLQYNGVWTEPQFMPVTIDPADGSKIKQVGNVFLTFESQVKKVSNITSKIKLIEGVYENGVVAGNEYLGSADEWYAVVDKNRLQVFPCDLDYYLTPIVLKKDKDYFLVIEPKAVYNSDNVYNKQIVVKYNAMESSGVEVVETQVSVVKNGNSIEVCVDGDANVQLYNAAGVMVGSVETADVATFGELSNGLYLVRVATASGVKTVKIVI